MKVKVKARVKTIRWVSIEMSEDEAGLMADLLQAVLDPSRCTLVYPLSEQMLLAARVYGAINEWAEEVG